MSKLEQAARQLLGSLESGMIDINAVTALREALDHSGEANEMVGCAYCNNPLFAGTKCNNCGLVTLAEQAEQEPVAWMVTMENQDGTRKTFPLSGRYKDVRDACDFGDPIPLYTHPVRTKDLTDEEIMDLVRDECIDMRWPSTPLFIARAVIAADRSKNGIV